MSDEALREHERRFRALGRVEDEAAWLRARVQVGDLSEQQVRLAAHVGHQAAAIVFGPESKEGPEALDRWLRQLSVHWDQEASVRAALAATAVTTAEFRASAFVAEAEAVAERWVLGPVDVRSDVPGLSERFRPLHAFPSREAKLAWVVGIHIHRTLVRPAGWGIPASTVAGSIMMEWPSTPVRASISRELAAWALGYSDPVRARVAKRGDVELRP